MTLMIATYNIRHGEDAGFDFDLLAESILQCGASVVGLQEIDVGTRRSHGLDVLSGLQKACGMPYAAFAPTMDFDGGQYGTGVMSMYPIKDWAVHSLPCGGQEPRGVSVCTLDTPWGALVWLNTHLSYETADLRAPQLAYIASLLPMDKPFVITGDFNTSNQAEFAPLLQKGGAMVNAGERLCMTFRQPPDAIDHIIYTPAYLNLGSCGMVENNHSDHNLLYATFDNN